MIQKKVIALAIATAAFGAPALHAATIATFKGELSTTPVSDTINNAVVTVINPFLSTSTSRSFEISDATGAIESFSVPTAVYSPVIGDNISITGLSEAFRGLYETAAPTTGYVVTVNSHNNLVTPVVFTAAEFQSGVDSTATQSTYGTLSGASFGALGGTTIASGATYTATVGVLSVAVFIPANDSLIGATLPSGTTSITGYFNEFDTGLAANTAPNNTGHELNALSFGAVPEPTSLGIIGLAFFGPALRRRRAK